MHKRYFPPSNLKGLLDQLSIRDIEATENKIHHVIAQHRAHPRYPSPRAYAERSLYGSHQLPSKSGRTYT